MTYNAPGRRRGQGRATNPFESAPTASTTVNGITVNVRFTGMQDTYTRADLDGGRAPLTSATHTAFDSMGDPVSVQYNGNDAVTGDERCTLTSYARTMAADGSAWLVNFPDRVQKFATSFGLFLPSGSIAEQVAGTIITGPNTGLNYLTSVNSSNPDPLFPSVGNPWLDAFGSRI